MVSGRPYEQSTTQQRREHGGLAQGGSSREEGVLGHELRSLGRESVLGQVDPWFCKCVKMCHIHAV